MTSTPTTVSNPAQPKSARAEQPDRRHPARTVPDLALCIPAYNAATFLPRLLASAQAQTIPFKEIWVYDDASQDDTAAVAAAHGAQVIRGETNRGCSWGKNSLAQRSQCAWIHFHDADEELLPNFVAAAQDWIDGEQSPRQADVILFGYEYREANGDRPISTYQFDGQALEQDAIAYCITHQVNPFCGLYRRKAMLACGGYDTDPAVLYNEDVAFHCRLALSGLRFAADPRTTLINYRNPQSMSSANRVPCLRAQYRVMEKVAQQLGLVPSAEPSPSPVQSETPAQSAPPAQLEAPARLQTSPERAAAYGGAIAHRLWQIAGAAAAVPDWPTADACVLLAQQVLPNPVPPDLVSSQPGFNQLCLWQPRLALRLREQFIRRFKPHLRPHLSTASSR